MTQIVAIECPETGKLLHTGILVDEVSWATGTFTDNHVDCPHCTNRHTWSKEHGVLVDSVTYPGVGA